jgi:hypothetical protein
MIERAADDPLLVFGWARRQGTPVLRLGMDRAGQRMAAGPTVDLQPG